ncbi:hypothetical protein HYS48_04965 [Candidatus Woesearchaeota archaeon]|nr:hypothetical protein [Candidatus Woesearchaeota archaeon]
MTEKIAYLYRENGGTILNNWFAVSYEHGNACHMPTVVGRVLRELQKEGYTIVTEGVPIEKIVAHVDAHKFRELNEKDKKELLALYPDLEHIIIPSAP